MRKLRKPIGVALAGAALVAGSVLAIAAPANAVVWSCSTGFSSVGVYGVCSGGEHPGDTYQVRILCQNIFTFSSYVKGGNWVTLSSGQVSTIQGCGWFEQYYGSPWISSL